jgi:hypothetical protein
MSARCRYGYALLGSLLFTFVASAQDEPLAPFAPGGSFYGTIGTAAYSSTPGVGPTNSANGFTSVEGMVPLFEQSGRELFFVDVRGLLSDTGHGGGNLGGGYRWLDSNTDCVFGLNAYYDNRDTGAATFQQFGGGFELLGRLVDLRGNFYLPLESRFRVVGDNLVNAGTASSAFPGFFPPLELTGHDVGALGGEFGRQSYTDGGVFDNLGVRMFRWLTPMLEGEKELDGVLVSDVGRRIEIQNSKGGGLVRAALRSSDILMDRVWQLELDNFQDTFGFVFAKLIDVVTPSEDSTALHPEAQRQVANIRTDLDGFTLLEISCLIRHGYCIGRQACRSRADLFGSDLPSNPPWDPIPSASIPQNAPVDSRLDGSKHAATPVTNQASHLQASSGRRIWSTLLSFRDWTSLVYLPFLALLVLAPYLIYDYYRHSRRVNQLIEYISTSSPDFEMMSRLVGGPMRPFAGVRAEDVPQLDSADYKGFNILQDARIVDLRSWNPNREGNLHDDHGSHGFRRRRSDTLVPDAARSRIRELSDPAVRDGQTGDRGTREGAHGISGG